MGIDRKAEGFSLRRWSERKLAARRDERVPARAPVPDDAQTAPPVDERRESRATVPDPAQPAVPPRAASSETPRTAADAAAAPALPDVESLTFDSDFAAFMRPGVDGDVRRTALRKLLRDPRFNVMDGLDVYIDDYSKPSPIEPEVVRTLWQARYLFDPPKTRVTADGIVEDVPADEAAVEDAASEGADTRPAQDALAVAPVKRTPADATAASSGDPAAVEKRDGSCRDSES